MVLRLARHLMSFCCLLSVVDISALPSIMNGRIKTSEIIFSPSAAISDLTSSVLVDGFLSKDTYWSIHLSFPPLASDQTKPLASCDEAPCAGAELPFNLNRRTDQPLVRARRSLVRRPSVPLAARLPFLVPENSRCRSTGVREP